MANTIRDLAGAKYVEMQNGRFARKPVADVFASGAWAKIRVALYCAPGDSGVDITGTPLFQVGLCSGTTNIPGDATPTNAVGVTSSAATWTYFSGGVNRKLFSGVTFNPNTQVAGVSTNGTALTANAVVATDGNANGNLTPFFVDITKGSPNYTLDVFTYNAGGGADFSFTEANYVAQSIVASPTGSQCALLGSKTIAFNETGGTLNAAYVYWNQSSPIFRITQWRVIRLS